SAMQDVFHVLGGLRRHLGAVPPIARTVVDGGGDRAAAVDDRPGQTTYVFDLTALSSAVLTNDCPERAGRASETGLRAGGADQSASGGRATVPPPTPTPTPQFSNAAPLRADEVTGAAAAALNTMAQAAIGQPQLLSNALNETGPGSL